jgi:hypothetical protein
VLADPPAVEAVRTVRCTAIVVLSAGVVVVAKHRVPLALSSSHDRVRCGDGVGSWAGGSGRCRLELGVEGKVREERARSGLVRACCLVVGDVTARKDRRRRGHANVRLTGGGGCSSSSPWKEAVGRG